MATTVERPPLATGATPELWAAVGCTAALLVYGNAVSAVPAETREGFLLWSNLGALASLLAWAVFRARMSASELGLGRRHVPASAATGAALSVVAAAPVVVFIGVVPLVGGSPVEAPELTDRSAASLAYFLLFREPVGTALFEEVAFRGVLYGAWQRVGGAATAFLATAGAFAAWHLVITSRTVADSGVVEGPALIALGVAVSLAGLFVGGLLFAYLRWRTGSIAAAAVAHWLIVAAMSLTVWSLA